MDDVRLIINDRLEEADLPQISTIETRDVTSSVCRAFAEGLGVDEFADSAREATDGDEPTLVLARTVAEVVDAHRDIVCIDLQP